MSPKWDAHIKRILKRAFERGRLSQAEYDLAVATPVTFDMTERTMTEAECLDWVKRITTERPSFASYETKTDRQMPVVRLTAR